MKQAWRVESVWVSESEIKQIQKKEARKSHLAIIFLRDTFIIWSAILLIACAGYLIERVCSL